MEGQKPPTWERKRLIAKLVGELNNLTREQELAVAQAKKISGVDEATRAARVRAAAAEWQALRDAKCVQLYKAGLTPIGHVRVFINNLPKFYVFPTYPDAVQAVQRLNALHSPATHLLSPTALQAGFMYGDGKGIRAGECFYLNPDDVISTMDENIVNVLNRVLRDRLYQIEKIIDRGDVSAEGRVVQLEISVESEVQVKYNDDEDYDFSRRPGRRLVHTITDTLAIGVADSHTRVQTIGRIQMLTGNIANVSVKIAPFRIIDFEKVAFVMYAVDNWLGLDSAVRAFIDDAKPRIRQAGAIVPVNRGRDRS